jgi:hypothetical protein
MKDLRIAALAIVALAMSLSACGGKSTSEKQLDDFASALNSLGSEQAALPKCSDLTMPGKTVVADDVSQDSGHDAGVCLQENGDAVLFFWTDKCKDGTTFVYSKENHAMGYDGKAWETATDKKIDAEQMKCLGF